MLSCVFHNKVLRFNFIDCLQQRFLAWGSASPSQGVRNASNHSNVTDNFLDEDSKKLRTVDLQLVETRKIKLPGW
jgi:hypothetical protein